ncbi:hypothetical protein SH528x_007147 [Novipirellula sp. SH528]|uniref:hypothetical protein n=1 Tax=Novipirellula sp. SH528 TaxID=3454466 RepID=UPI003FA0CF89
MSPLHDTESNQHEMHAGHELESGVLARVREWIDILPWLRLLRTLRMAGSPSMILIAMLTLAIWSPVDQWIRGVKLPAAVEHAVAVSSEVTGSSQVTDMAPPRFTAWFPSSANPMRAITASFSAESLQHSGGILRLFGSLLWTLIAWSFASLVFVRQGGLLTAGRSMLSVRVIVKSILPRSIAAWIAGIVPMLCVAFLAAMIWGLGWIAAWMPESGLVQFPLAMLITLLAIPSGILAFGAIVAVAFAWAAIGNERDPDALDALSRGYEYLYRRPAHLILYGVVSLVLFWIVMFLIGGVTDAAARITLAVLGGTSAPAMTGNFALQILALIPTATAFAFGWGLVGGVYLLIRFDAGGQQVEDVWLPAEVPADPFPTLPS